MADNSARLAELEAQYQSLLGQRNALGERYSAGEVDLLPQIKELNAEIRGILLETDALTAVSTPTGNTTEVVSTIPLPAAPIPSDTNTDPETRPFNQTQSIPAVTENTAISDGTTTSDGNTETAVTTPTATGSAGVGADDDNPQQANAEKPTDSNSNSDSSSTGNSGGTNASSGTTTGTGTGTQDRFGVVNPRPNILDQYASYTWSASLYLMSDEQYTQFIQSKKKNLNGYNLLIQSGGAPINKTGYLGNLQTQVFYENNGVTTTATAGAGRNPAFPLDFYIDNISVTSQLNGKGTSQAHGTANLKFQITEPNGITLLDRLYQAVQDSAPRSAGGPVDYAQARYLMVMRWYGYDENGVPVKPSSANFKTDPAAIVEKFIPFVIKEIKFTVSNRSVTYDFDCNPVGQMIAGTSRRGTVTSDVELTGKTVKDVLSGNTSAPASRGASIADVRRVDNAIENNVAPANAAGAPIIGSTSAVGLVQAMNSWQEELVKTGQREYADTYEIVFAPGAEAIQNAEVILLEPTSNQSATPMGSPTSKTPDSALSEKQAVSYNGRNIFVTAGTQMLYAIDYIIRNSSYIADQATVGTSEENNPYINQSKASTSPVKWYNISMEAIPDGTKYDRKVNAPVYKIRYVINAFVVQNFVSRFFPTIPYLGVHKSYPYWFTGENVAVLDYQATFNNMYQLVVSGSTPGNNTLNTLLKSTSASMRDQIKWYNAPRSNQSTSGAENRGNEIPAEAAEYLYDPGSLGEAKVRIIGDPAWIQQGSMLGSATMDTYDSAFLPDGTINFDGQQPMFEIAWQKPQDYDLATGLSDPYQSKSRNPVQSFVYTGATVVSEFRGGRFEQQLVGYLYPFPKPDGLNTAEARANAAAKDDRRLDNPVTGGRNSLTGAPLNPSSAPAGVNNENGARPAPVDTEVSNSGNNNEDGNGVVPADVVTPQSPPEPVESEGENVEWYDYEPPPKIGGFGDNYDPPQNMVIET